MNAHEYRTILLGGGMVAVNAANEFIEAGLKAGKLGIVSADDQQYPMRAHHFLALTLGHEAPHANRSLALVTNVKLNEGKTSATIAFTGSKNMSARVVMAGQSSRTMLKQRNFCLPLRIR
ncbi:MAG: hypothetical protein ACRD7E_10550 [Bryobacteraceae bacterium]